MLASTLTQASQIKQVDMGRITDFEFIQPDMIAYPEDKDGKANLIHILRLPSMEDDSKELLSENPPARKSFETLLTLSLPKLNRRPDRQSYKTTFYDAVTCIAKPDLRRDSETPADVGASLKRWGSEAQIVTSPDDAIIRMQYTIAHFYREIRIFTLLVHRSTLVELTKKFPPLMQDNGSNVSFSTKSSFPNTLCSRSSNLVNRRTLSHRRSDGKSGDLSAPTLIL